MNSLLIHRRIRRMSERSLPAVPWEPPGWIPKLDVPPEAKEAWGRIEASQARGRKRAALRLVACGWTYRQAANECGYSDHRDLYRDAKRFGLLDVHRQQLVDYGKCDSCHTSFSNWKDLEFDHNTQSRFSLEGAHATVACSRCHLPMKVADGSEVVQYKPLGRECVDCHEIDK